MAKNLTAEQKRIKELEKQLTAEQKKTQELLPGMELIKLKERDYLFATIRARYPKGKDYPDWKCYKMAGATGNQQSLRANASRALKNPLVQQYIAEQKAMQKDALALTGDDVIADIVQLKDMSMGRIPTVHTVMDDEGDLNVVRSYGVNATAAKGSLELLGRHFALFKDKVEHTGEDGAPLGVAREVHYVSAKNVSEVTGDSATE